MHCLPRAESCRRSVVFDLDKYHAEFTVDHDKKECSVLIINGDNEGGDYLVAVKGNQPALQRACHAAFDRACEAEFAGCRMTASVEDGHGRHEERYVTVIPKPAGMPEGWADVRAVVVVGAGRVTDSASCPGGSRPSPRTSPSD